jgi:hypothetical protein
MTVLGTLVPPEVKKTSNKVLPLTLEIIIQLTRLSPVVRSRQKKCFLSAKDFKNIYIPRCHVANNSNQTGKKKRERFLKTKDSILFLNSTYHIHVGRR